MSGSAWLHRPPRKPWWLAKYGQFVFLAALLGGVGLMFLYDTPMNAGYREAFAWLWAPWLIVVAGFTIRYWSWVCSGRTRWKGPLLAALTWPMLMVLSAPYLLLINSCADRGWAVYRGPVIENHIAGGRSRAPVVTIRDVGGRGELELTPKALDYDRVSIGQTVQCRYRIGWFGIAYRWRRSDQGDTCVPIARAPSS